jgi:peptidoglycan hydrolase-like protein with peptidoglycan-binding domain
MKTKIPLLTTIVLLAGSALAGAAPWDNSHSRRGPDSGRSEERYGRDDSRGGYARGHRMSLEARAQLRLRQMGYYRGPVDGEFGRSSRAALTRFQFRSGFRPTGWLDPRTIRALRL